MVYKFSRIQCVSCVATRLRKMFPILGLLACCVVSPAVAGETTPTDVSDQPASVQMINNSIERQMRAFEAALENSWHTDAQTTRLDELNLSASLREMLGKPWRGFIKPNQHRPYSDL